MTPLPNDDEHLIAFLKQYRPVPPAPASDREEKLMAIIERHTPPPTRQFYWQARLAFLTLAGVLVGWGSLSWLAPSPDTAELEGFLVNNWDGVIEEPSAAPLTNHFDPDWLSFTELETNSSPTQK